MLFHQEASLYAYIGMFMLMGIVKKNGIMIVDFALQRIARRRDRRAGDPRRQHGPLPPDHHDHAGRRHGRGADRAWASVPTAQAAARWAWSSSAD